MLCIWWDQKGVLYYELLKPGETIIGERYRTQLIRLKRAIADKRPEYATRHEAIIFHHDNAISVKKIRTVFQNLASFILGLQACAVLLGLNPQFARKMGKSQSFRWAML